MWTLSGKWFLISNVSAWYMAMYREQNFVRELRVEQAKRSLSAKKICRKFMLPFRWQDWYFLKLVNNYVICKISSLKTNVKSVPDKSCESGIRHRIDKVQLRQSTINQSVSRTVVGTQTCFLVCSASCLEEWNTQTGALSIPTRIHSNCSLRAS